MTYSKIVIVLILYLRTCIGYIRDCTKDGPTCRWHRQELPTNIVYT